MSPQLRRTLDKLNRAIFAGHTDNIGAGTYEAVAEQRWRPTRHTLPEQLPGTREGGGR